LDRKTREVTIDTQIMKVILSHDNQKQINWRYMVQKGVLEPLDLNVTLPLSATAALASNFGSATYNTLSTDGISAVVSYLETLGESKILANPRLTVVEGQEAKINIGTREAYVTSTTTTGSSTSTVSESVNFIDVGIILSVTPLINKKGYVTMKIKPEISSVIRTITTPAGNEIPIVDKTEAETSVMVKDGSTIVIGGLRKDDKSKTVEQIPVLSSLPIVGQAFKNRDQQLEQTEIVVFLTPRIIEGDERLSQNPDEGIKDLQPYPPQLPGQTSSNAADAAVGAKGQ
jgi:general secretion pathway protein D